ncbi:TfoX/Sxy family protein [Nocardiopsis suaedae]|uniref:TfoX/Sxy family protein n=1 Tax=Nocardiopsis suaedae TaxID=3018444 RepID=A0ABT4TJD7_9ACTN|nr:TfoX/Sxy family protein [Nocardiopsis suaedae]MDA2804787.1 TfoX/Sxy family protein [Nocardiopsis suaedae]
MAYDKELADRIREALAEAAPVREVGMFGGLSFMVNGKMAVTADTQGRLMVRCDPDRVDELLQRPGAEWAQMRGKPMSKGWIVVVPEGTDSDEDFAAWVREALEYNERVAGRGD